MTTYCVRVRLAGGVEKTQSFDSATARALWIISMTPYVDILEEFTSHDAR